jgi:hypothetical protein
LLSTACDKHTKPSRLKISGMPSLLIDSTTIRSDFTPPGAITAALSSSSRFQLWCHWWIGGNEKESGI